jgi:hypothetical protein
MSVRLLVCVSLLLLNGSAASSLNVISSENACDGGIVVGQPCSCGPDFCLNDPRYAPKLKAKKDDMRKDGNPDDLIALMDRDGACVARVDRAPTGFSMRVVGNDASKQTFAWSAEEESIAKKNLLAGKIKEYYKFNVAKAFACCEQPRAEERPDWDAAAELNRSLAIHCVKQGSTVSCK